MRIQKQYCIRDATAVLGCQPNGLAAATVDLLKDHRSLGQAKAGAAVFLRDQRRQPAGPGQRIDEGLGIGTLPIDFAEVSGGILRTEVAYGVAYVPK